MAWSRTGVKGMNAPDPVSPVKHGPGAHFEDTGLEVITANKVSKPGGLNFKDFDDMYFHGSGGEGDFDAGTNFETDGVSRWFKDGGSTTT
jgi:hypothetical protein